MKKTPRVQQTRHSLAPWNRSHAARRDVWCEASRRGLGCCLLSCRWDAVDVIGIDAYYHLDGATVAELTGAWQPYVQLAEQLHRQYNRTVAFTEIGYCSGHCSRHHTPGGNDYERHAMHYQAVFEAFRAKSWFEGAFWWNWDTDPGAFARDDCLTPQWKPAEDILRRYYRATHPKPPRPTQPAQCIGDGKCTC